MYDDTRDRLKAAAIRCVAEGGIRAATSRAITAAAGVNLGAITYYFGSKDELLAQALLEMIREQLEPVRDVLSGSDGDAQSRMLAAVAALLTSFESVRRDATPYIEALVNARRYPALRAGLTALLDELSWFLADQVSEQQAAGQLPEWISPPDMARLLIAVGNGIVLSAVTDPDGNDPAAMASQFARLLLEVRPPPT